MIVVFTGSYWSHASMYLGNGYIIESVKHGVNISPIKEALNGCNYIIYRCPYINEKNREDIYKNALSYINRPYDFGGCVVVIKKIFSKIKDDFKKNIPTTENSM